jgi:hypothetical protein
VVVMSGERGVLNDAFAESKPSFSTSLALGRAGGVRRSTPYKRKTAYAASGIDRAS